MPELNGFWNEGGFSAGAGIHVGWAISLRGGGLIAPAVQDADRKLARRADGPDARARGAGPRRPAA